MDDHDHPVGRSVDIAFDDPAAHGEAFTEALDGVLGHDFCSATVGEFDRPAARGRRFRDPILGREPSHRRRHQRPGQGTQNERARTKPELPDVVGDE